MADDPQLMSGQPGFAPINQDPLSRLLALLSQGQGQQAQGAAPTAYDDHLTGSALIDALNRRPQSDFGPNPPPPGYVPRQALPRPPSPYPNPNAPVDVPPPLYPR